MKKGILIALAILFVAIGTIGIAYAADDEFSEKIQKIFVTNTEPILIKLDGEVGGGCTIPELISVKEAPQKYEYKKSYYLSETEMNNLAKDGWELDKFEGINGAPYEHQIWKRPIN